MNFTATVLGTAAAALLLIAQLQAAPEHSLELGDANAGVTVTNLNAEHVGAIQPRAGHANAVRLIDLRSGASCKVAGKAPKGQGFAPAPMGPDCANSPALAKVSQWRANHDGTLDMADASGRTVLRFMPGDGVLYESVYPQNEFVTIVPARG
ncbi:hypothetical protein LQ948_03305 [Jiella sp. MQZ9-1]|uniref:Alkaline proteinase inhibitor/ Outer membrane lipoprotein Omp19 domain-containing protein n=1 Tax=Jiella flava TaxID=2816857 RepID=A0A939FXY8_9HYPH|nr:hypothetical protein [Jiella flava]MBO0661592.1 hypothetical protein [Jiella flava]MCD2470234.1 hypothetical protein [Jiella flava]